MGKQIQIAQSDVDEKETISWLSKKHELLSLPRIFDEAKPVPVSLGGLSNSEQMFFPKEFKDNILACVKRIEPAIWKEGTNDSINKFHVYPKALACIEWNRSQVIENTVRKGRYYLDTSKHEKPVIDEQKEAMVRLMNALMSRIRKVSPFKIDYRLPIYVGRDLSEKLLAGQLVPAGDMVKKLIPNE